MSAPASTATTARPHDLRIAFGDREVVVRSQDGPVMGALGRMFAPMRTTGTGRTVGTVEVLREDGQYVVRGTGGSPPGSGSRADALRAVRIAALQFLVDSRPDLLWLHAGVAARGGRALLFPAPPGGGKSTLVTRLCARGWSYLSDEIAPVDPLTATVHPFPQTPAVRQHPGREMPPEWLRMPNKRAVALPSDSVCRTPVPVAAVVHLSYRAEVRAEATACSPATTALHLLAQSWNAPEHRDAVVEHACALAQRVPGFSLVFHDGAAAADLVARELPVRA